VEVSLQSSDESVSWKWDDSGVDLPAVTLQAMHNMLIKQHVPITCTRFTLFYFFFTFITQEMLFRFVADHQIPLFITPTKILIECILFTA